MNIGRAIICVIVGMVTGACVAAIALKGGGNIVCREEEHDRIVFSGTLALEGEGLAPIEQWLDGHWSLCRESTPRVRCDLAIRGER